MGAATGLLAGGTLTSQLFHPTRAAAAPVTPVAIAQAAENRAKVEENRALVVLAESEVPKAMADAFRSGNMGIMDYYRMKNIQADTSMRDSIGGGDGHQTEPRQ